MYPRFVGEDFLAWQKLKKTYKKIDFLRNVGV